MKTYPKEKVESKQQVFQADGPTCFLFLLWDPHATRDSRFSVSYNDFITEQHFQFCLYSQYTSTHYNLQLSHIQLITINVIIVQIKTYFTTIKQSRYLTPLKKQSKFIV